MILIHGGIDVFYRQWLRNLGNFLESLSKKI